MFKSSQDNLLDNDFFIVIGDVNGKINNNNNNNNNNNSYNNIDLDIISDSDDEVMQIGYEFDEKNEHNKAKTIENEILPNSETFSNLVKTQICHNNSNNDIINIDNNNDSNNDSNNKKRKNSYVLKQKDILNIQKILTDQKTLLQQDTQKLEDKKKKLEEAKQKLLNAKKKFKDRIRFSKIIFICIYLYGTRNTCNVYRKKKQQKKARNRAHTDVTTSDESNSNGAYRLSRQNLKKLETIESTDTDVDIINNRNVVSDDAKTDQSSHQRNASGNTDFTINSAQFSYISDQSFVEDFENIANSLNQIDFIVESHISMASLYSQTTGKVPLKKVHSSGYVYYIYIFLYIFTFFCVSQYILNIYIYMCIYIQINIIHRNRVASPKNPKYNFSFKSMSNPDVKSKSKSSSKSSNLSNDSNDTISSIQSEIDKLKTIEDSSLFVM